MHGDANQQAVMLTAITPDAKVPQDHPSYAVAQRIRKRVEEIFGWMKTVGGGRKLRYLGAARNEAWATIAGAAYNLVLPASFVVSIRSCGWYHTWWDGYGCPKGILT